MHCDGVSLKAVLRSLVILAAAALIPADAAGQSPGLDRSTLSGEDLLAVTAMEHYQEGKVELARGLAAGVRDPLAAEILLWQDMSAQDTPRGFREITAFLNRHPDWPGQRRLQQQAERALPVTLPDAEILAWFQDRRPRTVEGTTALADALIRNGRSAEARDLLQRNWIALGFTRDQERAFLRKYRSFLSRELDIARLDRLLWDRRKSEATRLAARLGSGYPALAAARLALANRSKAVDRAIRKLPSRFHQDAGFLYERARWRQRKGRFDGVIEILDPPDPSLARPEKWWRLRDWATRKAIAQHRYSLAYRLSSNHGMTSGIGFADGEWLAGWIALRFLKKPAQALPHFKRLFDGVTSPISLSRGAYWAGEAAWASGDRAGATGWYEKAARYPTAFYGQLAHQRLGRSLTLPASHAIQLSSAERQAFAGRDAVSAARLLHRLGQRKLAQRFIYALRSAAVSAADFVLLADLARGIARPDLAVSTAKLARRSGVLLLDDLYPTDAPAAARPEPALVMALIRQESVFDSQAVSRAGARGLMQLMPATAKQVARETGVPYSRSDLTDDPDYNTRLGRAYLANVLDRFGGSYILGLASYNAGPHRAAAWIVKNGDPRARGTDPVDWIESIPFSETRNYVQRILESLSIYRLRLPGAQGGWRLTLAARS